MIYGENWPIVRSMWSYLPQLLERPVPRYTSYPTAAEFHDGVDAANLESALESLAANTPVSLYVHIPFCREICWYCGCNTGAANRQARLEGYLDALESEIALIGQRLAGRANVQRIAFGGGSPNALQPVQFVRLIDRLMTRLGAFDADLSIEIDPRSFSPAWAKTLGATRASRASLGVQTFSPQVQRAIGRIQSRDMVLETTDLLRAAGVTSINYDLMYGLPAQTMEDLDTTLDETIRIAPERIAIFGYAHMPSLLARQRRIDASALPDQATRFAMAQHASEKLTAAGYLPIGFDHFALPHDPMAIARRKGMLRRNFQGFTDDSAAIMIGLGASAISQFPNLIVQNEKNAGRYRMRVASGMLAANRGVRRFADDRRRGLIIEKLLCHDNVQVDARDYPDAFAALEPFMRAGLLIYSDGALRVSHAGLPYARSIAACFDSYRPMTQGKFSHAV